MGESAKFLGFLVRKKGGPVLVPATELGPDKVSMRRIDVRLPHPRLAVTPPSGIAGIVAMGYLMRPNMCRLRRRHQAGESPAAGGKELRFQGSWPD